MFSTVNRPLNLDAVAPFAAATLFALVGLIANLDPRYLEILATLTVAAAGLGLCHTARASHLDSLLILSLAGALAACIVLRAARIALLDFGLGSGQVSIAVPVTLWGIAPLGASMMTLRASHRLLEIPRKRWLVLTVGWSVVAFAAILAASLSASVGSEILQSEYVVLFILDEARGAMSKPAILRSILVMLAASVVVGLASVTNRRYVAQRGWSVLFVGSGIAAVNAANRLFE